MRKYIALPVVLVVGTVLWSQSVIARSDVCEPTQSLSPFAGIEKYETNLVAKECFSAYPRIDDESRQADWELAVYKRCLSLYRRSLAGPGKQTYREACTDALKKFEKVSASWKNISIVDKAHYPVCGQGFNKDTYGQLEYVCKIYYTTAEDNGTVAEPLKKGALLVGSFQSKNQ